MAVVTVSVVVAAQVQPRGGGVPVHHVRAAAGPAGGPGGGRGGPRAGLARRAPGARAQPRLQGTAHLPCCLVSVPVLWLALMLSYPSKIRVHGVCNV